MYKDKCSCCGKCCSNLLPLTNNEITRLKNLVRKRKIKPYNNYLLSDCDLVCPFLDNKNKCIIYEDRPLICKEYTCKKFALGIFTGITPDKYRLINVREEIFKWVKWAY